ncbi:MAG: DUF4363 family protein [Ruminococcus sp.]|nr:DUF4363 family protein [Ruminococcus sp.]
MKRIILCASLLLFICISSFLSLNMLKKNTTYFTNDLEDISRLYQLERYDEAYRKADMLYAEWKKLFRTASVIVDLDRLEEINSSFAKLMPLINIQAEETESEIKSLSKRIERLYGAEIPLWYNVF